MCLLLSVSSLFDSESITVRAGGPMWDKGDPVSGHNPVIQAVDGIITEYSFDFIDGKFQLLGDFQRRFTLCRKLQLKRRR
jgi:hypothetical protein